MLCAGGWCQNRVTLWDSLLVSLEWKAHIGTGVRTTGSCSPWGTHYSQRGRLETAGLNGEGDRGGPTWWPPGTSRPLAVSTSCCHTNTHPLGKGMVLVSATFSTLPFSDKKS